MSLTSTFAKLTNDMKKDYPDFVRALESVPKDGIDLELNHFIVSEFGLDKILPKQDMTRSLKTNIEQFIQQQNTDTTMPFASLQAVTKQLHLDILLHGSSKLKEFNYGLSNIMSHHVIKPESLPDFSQRMFWTDLLRRLYALSVISSTSMPEIQDMELPEHLMSTEVRLVKAIKHIQETLNISIGTHDGEVHFKKGQEKEIIRRLESGIRETGTLHFIALLTQNQKLLKTYPLPYLLNLAVKQVPRRSISKLSPEKSGQIIQLAESYIALYQLKNPDFWERMYVNTQSIEALLKRQMLFAVGYRVDKTGTETLKTMIRELLFKHIDHAQLIERIGFDANSICNLLDELERPTNIGMAIFTLGGPHEAVLSALSIDVRRVNTNYGPISSLEKVVNPMVLHPVVEHDSRYYVFGYGIQKINFYIAILTLLHKADGSKIFNAIGNNIDNYMINAFSGHTTYHGKYRVRKGQEPECDLVVELDDEIIFIENKNKSLTAASYTGSSIDILKDLIMSFVTSQTQLLQHEEYLLRNGSITFNDGRTLGHNGKRISKVSMTSMNWNEIMLNDARAMLYTLNQIRFTTLGHASKEDKMTFEKVNKQLDKLSAILHRIQKEPGLDLHTMLMNSLFLPIELVVEFGGDGLFVQRLQKMFRTKINNGNNAVDHYNLIKNHVK